MAELQQPTTVLYFFFQKHPVKNNSGGIASTNNVKYDSIAATNDSVVVCFQKHPVQNNNIIFCFGQHPTNSIPRLQHQINTFNCVYIIYRVSAPNQSLEERTECDDDGKDLDNIKTIVNNIVSSLAIVHCEFKNGKVISQQCEYKSGIVQFEYKNDKVTSKQYEYNKNKVFPPSGS